MKINGIMRVFIRKIIYLQSSVQGYVFQLSWGVKYRQVVYIESKFMSICQLL